MTEEELVIQSKRGDRAAYGRLAERYYGGLVRHVTVMTQDVDMAEDVVQESLIAAYLQLHRYRPEFRFSTWLYRIATNKALDYLKRRRPFRLEEADEVAADVDLEAELVGAEALAERAATIEQLRALIPRLPERYQLVIGLFYWDGLSCAEIAVVLGVPTGTVKTWLARARRQLRKEMT